MPTSVSRRPPALLAIDAENQTDLDVRALLEQLSDLDIVERRAYADLRDPHLNRVLPQLRHADIHIHHEPGGGRLGAVKDAVDSYMNHDIRAILARRPEIDVVVIVSGDHGFAEIAKELGGAGKCVIVAANPHCTAKALRAVAHRYIPGISLGRQAPAAQVAQAAMH